MFTAALGGMKKYDPFMELTLGLYTADLDSFVKAFEGASPKIAYFPSTFTTAAGKRFYSIQVQVPGSLDAGAGSLLLLELVSTTSPMLEARSSTIHHHPVARFSAQSLSEAENKASSTSGAGATPTATLLKIA